MKDKKEERQRELTLHESTEELTKIVLENLLLFFEPFLK